MSGAPKSTRNPTFRPVRLQYVMREVRRPVLVRPGQTYTEIGVRSHGKGVFHKEPITGDLLGNKRVFWLRPGTLVFNIVFAWERAVAVLAESEAGLIGSHRFPTYEMLPGRAHAGFMKHYFTTGYGHYLLELNSPGAAGRNKTLNQSALMKEEVWLPAADAQKAIADFLDRKTAAMDALIEKKQKLLDLLAEKRAALINQAVTKGLDPNVAMKDSGIPWIGEIPAHWEVVQVRRLLDRLDQGWSPVAEDRSAEDGEWAVLKLSAVSKGVFRPDQNKVLLKDYEPRPGLTLFPGDLLVTRANTPQLVGDACVVRTRNDRLMLSDLIYRLRLSHRASPEFVCLFLTSTHGRAPITADARGSSQSMVKISQGHIKAWPIPLPPPAEQHKVAAATNDGLTRIRATEGAVKTHIERIQEYRQALITAAVTGQLRIGEEAA